MKGLEHVNVVIHKDSVTHIALTVPTYELPVLQEMFDGQDEAGQTVPRVHQQGDPFLIERESFDAVQALDALRRKYRSSLRAVAAVYRDARSLKQASRYVEMKPERAAA